MSELETKRNLAEQAKEKIHRKRIKTRLLEHVGTTTLTEDGRAVGKRAEPGEYFIARVGFWGYTDRKACGNESPYNDEKSKAPISEKLDKVAMSAKGAELSEIESAVEHNNRKVRNLSFEKSAAKEIG